MNFNEYQVESGRTDNGKLGFEEGLTMTAMGIASEAGEIAEHIKHWRYHGHELNTAHLLKELGDLEWYIARMAARLGHTLEEVAHINVEKLRARYPEGFSEKRSRERNV